MSNENKEYYPPVGFQCEVGVELRKKIESLSDRLIQEETYLEVYKKTLDDVSWRNDKAHTRMHETFEKALDDLNKSYKEAFKNLQYSLDTLIRNGCANRKSLLASSNSIRDKLMLGLLVFIGSGLVNGMFLLFKMYVEK